MCLQIHAGVQWTPDLGYPSQQTERKMMQRTRRKIDAAPKAKFAPEALWGTGDGWPICLAPSGSTGKQIGQPLTADTVGEPFSLRRAPR